MAVTQLPGDPVRALFGFTPPPRELYESLRRRFGLDLPVWEQYAQYLGRLLTGDLGNSYPLDPFGRARVGPAVSETMASAVPISARVVLGAVLLQLVVGVVAGALSARRAVRGRGGALYLLALLLVSTPVLVAAYVLRLVVAQEAGLLPASGLLRRLDRVRPAGAVARRAVHRLRRAAHPRGGRGDAGVAVPAAPPAGAACRTARLLAVHALRPVADPGGGLPRGQHSVSWWSG